MSSPEASGSPAELSAELFPGNQLKLNQLPWETFERLSRALFQLEPEIQTVESYGIRGQTQYGIDILAYRADDTVEVAQCKCYANITDKQIRAAADEFLKHWTSRWESWSVRRFVLIVASSLHHTKVQDEIQAQKRRFRALGVRYEVWSATTINDKLAPHPDLVERFFVTRSAVEVICGVRPAATQPSPALQQEALLQSLAERVESEFHQTKRKWQEGSIAEVKDWIRTIKESPEWTIAKATVKAEVLRIEAYLLVDASPEKARALADEAAATGRTAEQIKLEAYLALRTQGSEAAFAILGDADVPLLNNFKAAIRLEEGDITSCLAHLESAQGDDPEALRLRASAYLFSRLPQKALAEIELAEQLAGHRLAVRESAAVIRFYQMVAPGALPTRPWHLKTPIEINERMTDQQSLASLERAIDEFDLLSRLVQDERQRFELQTWNALARLCHPQFADEGLNKVEELLTLRPATPSLIHWTLCFTDLNLQLSLPELQQRLSSHELQADGILALVHLLLSSGQPAQARQVLEEHQEQFALGKEVWTQWYCRCLMAGGEPEEALRYLEGQADTATLKPLRLALSHSLGRLELDEYVVALEAHADQTGDTQLLLQACEIQNQAKNWEWVNQRSQKLLSSLPTPRAVLLCMVAAYNTGHPEICLELAQRFPTSAADFSKLKYYSLLSLSRSEEALIEAKSAADTFGPPGLILLANYYSTRGDTAGMREVGQRILKHNQVEGFPLLHLSRNLLVEDPQLARELWTRAARLGISEQTLSEAVLLGLQLGAESEEEWDTLLKRSLERVPADHDAESFAEQIREMRSRTGAEYFGGAPLYNTSKQMRTTLAYFFHEIASANAAQPQPLQQLPIFSRSGARSLATELPDSRDQLCLDLTSLLLANQLGVLDELIAAFPGLRIAPSVPAALQNMAILHAPRGGLDEELERCISELVQAGALTTIDDVASPEAPIFEWGWHHPELQTGNGVSPQALLSWLKRNGRISQAQFSEASLAFDFAEPDECPTPGSDLMCSLAALSVFYSLGLLKTVAESMKLTLLAEEWQGLLAAGQLRERSKRTVAWIRSLVEKIEKNRASGSMTFLPVPQKLEDGPELGCLQEMLSAADDHLLICVDDRFINAYNQQENEVPLLSLVDVLHCLRASGKLSDDRYYFLLNRLRAANFHYLPVHSEEILYQLSKAAIADRQIVETPELTQLRKQIAASIQRALHLRKPERDDQAEWPWLMDLTRQIRIAIATLFHPRDALSKDETDQIAQANWILESLYVDLVGARGSTGLDPDDGDLNRRSVELACLLAEVITSLAGFQNAEVRARENYLNWISTEFLSGYFMPVGLPRLVGQTLGSYFSDFLDGVPTNSSDLLEHARALLQRTIDQLPELFKRELLDNEDLCERAELKTEAVLSVEGIPYQRSVFIQSFQKLGGEFEIQLTALDGSEGALTLDPLREHPILRLPGREIALNPIWWRLAQGLSDSDFQTLRPWFDCPERLARQHFHALKSIGNPVDRFTTALEWQSQSAELRYRGLFRAFTSEEESVIGEFLEPVAPQRLLARYALGQPDSVKKFPSRILEASQTLLDESLEVAFSRLCCFPVPLPKLLVKKFDALKPKQLDRFLKSVRSRTASPLGRLHLIHLLLGSPRVQDYNLAIQLVGELLSDGASEDIRTFLVIVRWARQWFSSRYWSELPEHLILALSWAHADELFHIIRRSNRDARQAFENYLDPSIEAQSPLQEQPGFRQDACYPSNLRPVRFLEAGLGYAFSRGPALPQEFSSQLESRLFPWGKEYVPSSEYLFRAWGSNALGSWLGERSSKSLSKIVSPEAAERLSNQGLKRLALEAASDLIVNPNSHTGWLILAPLCRGSGSDTDLSEQLNQIFDSLEIDRLLRNQSSERRTALLLMICEVALQVDTSRRKELFRGILKTSAAQLDGEHSDPALVGSLLDAALRLASSEWKPLERAQLFSELVCELIAAIPDLAHTCIPTLTRLCCRLTPNLARPVWKALTLARALGGAPQVTGKEPQK